MSEKHTPGPWRLTGVATIRAAKTNSDPNGRLIARIHGAGDVLSAEAEANTRLIAAAPDLLAALKDFVAMGEQCNWDSALTSLAILMRNARAAIAKAEGRS